MRKTLPKKVKVKASGGIRTRKFALELIEAGADRLGCSRSLDIIKE
jgi:deoxyribose-phosphate aldolase